MLAESWRLAHFTEKFADGADDKLRKKISNQVTRFDKHFHATAEAFGLEVVDFTGAEFETGLPVAPINLADFAAEEKLFVAAMLEPTIKIAGSASVFENPHDVVENSARIKRRASHSICAFKHKFYSVPLSLC